LCCLIDRSSMAVIYLLSYFCCVNHLVAMTMLWSCARSLVVDVSCWSIDIASESPPLSSEFIPKFNRHVCVCTVFKGKKKLCPVLVALILVVVYNM
jgi:hypothetical protein